ncbi:hypothetical protein DL95DRAFT_465294 [Leptodontidium sp. 2 PMI_412]|nr:hypothetical protein DL95DRAFT_465294 [Leptodontidium sp. 2 PMI_412]
MQDGSHQHHSTNQINSQPDLSLPLSTDWGFEGETWDGYICTGSDSLSSPVVGIRSNSPNTSGILSERQLRVDACKDLGFSGLDASLGFLEHKHILGVSHSHLRACNTRASIGAGIQDLTNLPYPFDGTKVFVRDLNQTTLIPNRQFVANVPWDFAPQSPAFNTSPWFTENDVNTSTPASISGWVNGQDGSAAQQPNMVPFDFNSVNSINPKGFNSGSVRTPSAVLDGMGNLTQHNNFWVAPAPSAILDVMGNFLPNINSSMAAALFTVPGDMGSFAPSVGFGMSPVVAPLDPLANFTPSMNFMQTSLMQPIPSGRTASTATSARHGRHHQCRFQGCNKSFGRRSDRDRHEDSVHSNIRFHFCPVVGCNKSFGGGGCGYTRADKVTDHLRKKH